jgi:D-inositol-3-phosphate glycosyltransferase
MDTRTVIISYYGVGGSFLYLQKLMEAFRKKDCPVGFYLPKECESQIRDACSCRFLLKEPSTHPPFLEQSFLKYPYHLMKYLYNAFTVSPDDRNIKIAHFLFPFYLTDLITVLRFKRKGIRVVLSLHEIFPHKPFLGGRADMKIMRKLYELSDLLIVHSDSLKKELLSLFPLDPVKVRTIRHGYFELPESYSDVNALRRKYCVASDKKVLLFFGNIRENKGLDILLNVMREIKDDFFLLIAGGISGASERSSRYYMELISENGVSNSVHWLNRYVSDEECSEVFKLADALILPYKKTFHAQSGVLNLAAGFEKPCVVSDVGGIGEIVRSYSLGVVVRPEDVQDLQRGIKDVFADKVEFAFARYKEDNSWEGVCDEFIRVYEELLTE